MLHLIAAPDIRHHQNTSGQRPITEPSILIVMKASVVSAYAHDPKRRAITWVRVVAAAVTNEECCILAEYIQNRFPESHHELPTKIQQFWPVRVQMYFLWSVPIKEKKILTPRQFHATVLEALHSAHQGDNEMVLNTQQWMFWPGLIASI